MASASTSTPSADHPPADFALGPLTVSPSRRLVEGPAGTCHLQPQAMRVLLRLAADFGSVVSRRGLFASCWGSAAVGDDSLNRAITAIRSALAECAGSRIKIQTIAAAGYRLFEAAAPPLLEQSIARAVDCWRLGAPTVDAAEIEALQSYAEAGPPIAANLGTLALLLRKAAEYSGSGECSEFVRRCGEAARQALQLDPTNGDARVALAGLAPLSGNWTETREALLAILEDHPLHVPARHDLAVLEMATGRVSAAFPLIADLLADDGHAATFQYKRMYHLWSTADLNGAEQIAMRALQMWPHHPAIWTARYWILIFTERAEQAVRLVTDPDARPQMPAPVIAFLEQTAKVVSTIQAGEATCDALARHQDVCLQVAARGPAQAVAALQGLCAIGAIDPAFEVAYGYYLGQGRTAAPLRWNPDDPSITDQHRRVTQPLFIPATRAMREDPRFIRLCDDMGLTAYWERFGLKPDFLAT